MSKITIDYLYKKTYTRAGFSLIELLIVIAIISLFGFLVFSMLEKSEMAPEPYNIKELKSAIGEMRSKDAELICINKCTQCSILTSGGGKPSKIKSNLKEIQAYILDNRDNPQKLDFGRMDDNPICLRFRYYANGSTTQIILESEEKFFYFPSYFGEVEVFDSIDEAADRWVGDMKVLRNRGDYY